MPSLSLPVTFSPHGFHGTDGTSQLLVPPPRHPAPCPSLLLIRSGTSRRRVEVEGTGKENDEHEPTVRATS